MAVRTKLTIAEQIDRARDGRTQTSIIEKMKDAGVKDIDDFRFSRKKLEKDGYKFTPEEISVLSEILGTEITMS